MKRALCPIFSIILVFFLCAFGPFMLAEQSSGRLAFIADFNGTWDLFVIDANGANLKNLTADEAEEIDFKWSPDGTKILYEVKMAKNDYRLVVIGNDGTNPLVLDTWKSGYSFFSWSPDGTRILAKKREGWGESVFVISADGTGYVQLAGPEEKPSTAAWSPDGRRILLCLNHKLYLVNPDGTERIKLTKDAARCAYASWSPDGTKIAFMATYPVDIILFNVKEGLYIVSVQNDTLEKFYKVKFESPPQWSPDGNRLAFLVETWKDIKGNTYQGLKVINLVDGKTKTYNLYNPYFSWSPDSTKIACMTSGGITIIDLEEKNKNVFIPWAKAPAWSPDGSRLCFVKHLSLTNVCLALANADGTGLIELTGKATKMSPPAWAPR